MAGTISQTNVAQFNTGLTQALSKIDANVVAQVWGEALPIVGDNIKDLATSGAAQLHYAANLGAAIKQGLDALVGKTAYTAAEVEAAINTKLAAGGFSGLGVAADFTAAGDLKLAFATADSGDSVSVAAEQNLGLGHLDIKATGTASTTLTERLDFSAGVDASGFYLSTGSDAHFSIQAGTRLPTLAAAAEIGGVVVKAVNTGGTGFDGQFDMTLKDGDGDGKLRIAELNGDLVDATLTGRSFVDLNLTTTLPLGSVMPKLGSGLQVGWNFDKAVVNPLDDNSDFGDVPTVKFQNGTINLGSFFDGMSSTVLQEVSQIIAPMKPIIDFLTTPIPLLSDLGSSKVTLLDFMGLDNGQASVIKGLSEIADLVTQIANFGDAAAINITLGSSQVTGDIRTDLAADLVTTGTLSGPDLASQNIDLGTFLKAVSMIDGGGLAFPILHDAAAIGNILLGNNVDLFTYQAQLGFDYSFKQFFPVMGPVGVTLGGLFGLKAKFDFGFDTQGLHEYAASGMTDPSKIFDGFYVNATDEAGNPTTGFQIYAGVTAGLVATIGFAEIGGEGDITANINFGIDPSLDPLDTGKVRGAVLALTSAADLFDPSGSISAGLRAYLEVGISPFSIEFSFDSPRITLLDFDGDKSQDPVLSTLLGNGDLALNIGDRSAERLVGNLSDTAEKIEISLKFDVLAPDVVTGLVVGGFNVGENRDLPGRIIGNGGNSSDEIFMDARINVAALLTGGVGRDILTSGAANDTLIGDETADLLSGNGGVDQLFGGLGHDKLIGGAGADILDGGVGLDTASYANAAVGMTIDLRTMLLTGDGIGDVLISIERFEGSNLADLITGDNASNPLLSGLDGNDTIRGLDGDDLLLGGLGNDSLDGGAGNDMLIGAEGADTLTGGAGTDILSFVTSKGTITVSLLTGSGSGGDATGDVISGIENLIGSALPFGDLGLRYDLSGRPLQIGTGDILQGSDAANIISGLGGADFIDGAGGDDVLYGDAKDGLAVLSSPDATQTMNDFEQDTIKGGLGNDKLYGQTGGDDLDGGLGQDTLDGAEGNDHLRTMDTGSIDVLDGGVGVNRLSADYSDKTVSINWIVGQNNDTTFLDGDSQRNFQNIGELDTGSKRDVINLEGTLPNGTGDDGYGNIIRTNGGNDLVYSGNGTDLIDGGAGKDQLFGGADGDMIDGGAGDDFVNGGSNNIILTFGAFGVITGYTSGFGGPDHLNGGSGIDTVSFESLSKPVVYLGGGINGGKEFLLGVTVDLMTGETGGSATGTGVIGFENIIGTDYADSLLGTDGNNVFTPLRGGGLFTGANSGPDRIDGRGGIDTLVIDFSSFGVPARGIMTNGASIARLNEAGSDTVDSYFISNIENLRITGDAGNDTLYSAIVLPGDDYLNGMDGDDHLGGNGGSDTLLGGVGNDAISAQGTFGPAFGGIAGGRDVLSGGSGDDLIEDIAFGAGTTVLGANALLKLDGGIGFDTLSADFSNQTVAIVWNDATPTDLNFADGAFARGFEQLRYFASGKGNDVITQGGRVSNQFYLGDGDDVVNAGLGFDTVDGGIGNDVLIVDYSVGDAANLSGLQGGGTSNVFFRTVLADGSRPDNLSYRGIERMQVTGTSKADNFSGSIGNDTLSGGLGNDSINGLNGGNDLLDGGAGDDTLMGSGGFSGGTGADTLLGGSGNDQLRALAGDDSLGGGDGNDVILADFDFGKGYGIDVVAAGTGDDLVTDINLRSIAINSLARDRLQLDGGVGNDTLSADFGDQTQAIVFTSGISNSVNFTNGSYLRNFENIINLYTGTGNDQVTQLGRVNNILSVSGGDDSVNAGLGVDTVYGGAGNDLLILDYSQGDEANVGGVINEPSGAYARHDLTTNAVIDSILALDFERVQITGGSKADLLVGLAGDDVLSGGGGNDLLRGLVGKDAINGGNGVDTADYGEKFGAVTVTLAGAAVVSVLVGGVVEDSLRNIENLIGGFASDALTGDSKDNALTGGSGLDTLAGMGGADSFIFRTAASGVDVIQDFASGSDTIRVLAAGFGGGLVAGGAAELAVTTDVTSFAGTAVARFIYDTDGADAGLYWDLNGADGANSVLIARLAGLPALIAADIVIF